MTSSTPTNPPVLPADAKCPRCGYEFGIAGQTRCSECGLALDDRTIREFRLRKLGIGIGINIIIIAFVATVMSLRIENWGFVFGVDAARHAGVAAGAVLFSLLTGSALAMFSKPPERILCVDAWARSHFILFAQWFMLPYALSDTPPISSQSGVLIWIALVFGAPLATGAVYFTLRHRRQIRSKRTSGAFIVLVIAFAAVHTTLFIGVVMWDVWQQLSSIAC